MLPFSSTVASLASIISSGLPDPTPLFSSVNLFAVTPFLLAVATAIALGAAVDVLRGRRRPAGERGPSVGARRTSIAARPASAAA
jgi:hypothetical protein